MAAVLDDAIDVYRRPEGHMRRRLRRETEAWFRSNDRSCLYAFVRVCGALGLDPQAIRDSLAQERLEHMLAA